MLVQCWCHLVTRNQGAIETTQSHEENVTSDGTRKAVVFATMAKLPTDGSLGFGKIHAMQLFDEVVSVEQSKN